MGGVRTQREHTGVRRRLGKAVLQQPWEQRTLLAAACLGHAVDGLFYAADARAAIAAEGGVPRRGVTVHHFALLQFALEIRRDKFHRRMSMPLLAAMDARARSDVGRMVAQNV
eukprot:3975053-Pleurochrysis_carterae.AAC.3